MCSDGASFKLSSHNNRHNCVYLYIENMHLTLQQEIEQLGANIWGWCFKFWYLEPINFYGTVTGDKYLEILIAPQLQKSFSSR